MLVTYIIEGIGAALMIPIAIRIVRQESRGEGVFRWHDE